MAQNDVDVDAATASPRLDRVPNKVGSQRGRGDRSTDAVRRQDSQREHNLALLLKQIHRDGALTRAALTARLGLNRSTVLALVAELSRRNILEESEEGSPGPRGGRRSYVVRPSDRSPYVFSVDITVSVVTIAAFGIGGAIRDRKEVDISGEQNSPAHVAGIVADHMAQVMRERPDAVCLGVGASIPGWLSPKDAVVAYNPNLRWNFVSFEAELTPALRDRGIDVPVSTGNDANLGAMAERAHGDHIDGDNLIYLLGRAGVGTGVVSSGILLTGKSGAVGEIGHVSLDPNGLSCHCGRRGCVEVYIGDAALVREAAERGLACDSAAQVLARAADGDAAAVGAVTATAAHLGRTMSILVNLFDPGVIVAAGTLGRVLELDRESVAGALRHYALANSLMSLEVRTAFHQAPDSTLVGAGELAFRQFLEAPLETHDSLSGT